MTIIDQDFLDIDPCIDNWFVAEYEGKHYVVPDTDAGSDMTHAMMSIIPGWTSGTPIRETPFWNYCMAFLMQDGNLGVPGGRYGGCTIDCADTAIVMTLVMQYHNGEPITYYSLNSDMGSVVNSSDGVAETLSESQYILDDFDIDVKDLLGDEYLPNSAMEMLSRWAEVDIDNGLLKLTLDEDDCDRLLDDIRSNEVPFRGRE